MAKNVFHNHLLFSLLKKKKKKRNISVKDNLKFLEKDNNISKLIILYSKMNAEKIGLNYFLTLYYEIIKWTSFSQIDF